MSCPKSAQNKLMVKEFSYVSNSSYDHAQGNKEPHPGAGVLLFASDCLGSGDEDLGRVLIATFIDTLAQADPRPYRMIFVNSGVLLTAKGSRTLNTLQQLEKAGVDISCCGTCVNHYGLNDKLKVGRITNMYDIVTCLLNSDKVVRV